MRIAVIDGMGGGLAAQVVSQLTGKLPEQVELIGWELMLWQRQQCSKQESNAEPQEKMRSVFRRLQQI